jgi:hypothetical protein
MTLRSTYKSKVTNTIFVFCVLLFGVVQKGISQIEPVVTTSIDTTAITIGEEIKYTLKAEVDQTATVVFPEGQTFSPLEMIESYKVDTAFAKAPTSSGNYKMTLVKKYGLTQFDSGSYKIPRQRIVVGNKTIETDSFRVEVANVVLDTVNQGLYDIKPAIEVPKDYGTLLLKILMWLIPLALAIGLFLYWLLRRHKRKKEEERYVPPFEQALATLKELDESNLIEKSEYKAYYTTLTEAIRRYYDEKVYDRALESTTDELIQRLQAERESGHIDFSTETIKNLKDIFQRADLVKFARINPPEGKALADRIAIEQIVKETKKVLPAPTQEELMRDEMYRAAIERRRKRKLWLTGAGGILGILLVALGIGIAVKGFSEVKDFVLGNATRELAEGQWITSEYGVPSMVVSSPKALTRDVVTLPEGVPDQGQVTSFTWSTTPFAVSGSITQSKLPSEDKVNLEMILENKLKVIEGLGFKLGLVKNDPYTTTNGAEGVKTFGTGSYTIPKTEKSIPIEYASLIFQAGNLIQQFTVVWKEDDPYAKQIAERMINSVELQAPKEEK